MQSLATGLVEQSLGWKRLLLQEGIYWKPCSLKKGVSAKQFAVVIVNRKLGKKEKENLERFKGEGGAVLHDISSGKVVENESSSLRGFTAASKCLPERASTVDKGAVRRHFSHALKKIFKKRGLPFAQLWVFPGKASSVLSFHLDIDNADLNAVERVLESVEKAGLKATWFVNGEACSAEPRIVRALLDAKQDVESHSWQHEVFDSFEKNNAELQKSISWLRKSGVKSVRGISTPNGHWNSSMAKALEKNEISSVVSFSLSFLDLPFFAGKVLALAVHPICVGIMKTRDFSEREMKRFFLETIDKCIEAELPCFFYGHPSKRMERYPGLIQAIAEHASRREMEIVSLQEYAGWWRKRNAKKFEAFLEKGRLVVKTKNKEPGFCLRVVNSAGKQKLLELKAGKAGLSGKEWGKRESKSVKFTCDSISSPGIKHTAKAFGAKVLGK